MATVTSTSSCTQTFREGFYSLRSDLAKCRGQCRMICPDLSRFLQEMKGNCMPPRCIIPALDMEALWINSAIVVACLASLLIGGVSAAMTGVTSYLLAGCAIPAYFSVMRIYDEIQYSRRSSLLRLDEPFAFRK